MREVLHGRDNELPPRKDGTVPPDAQRYDSFSEIESARERTIEAFGEAAMPRLSMDEFAMLVKLKTIAQYAPHLLDELADSEAEFVEELEDGEAA